MSELKPCPFCGGGAEVKKSTLFGNIKEYARIVCKSCLASTKNFNMSLDYSAVEEATKAWNRRAERSVRNDTKS